MDIQIQVKEIKQSFRQMMDGAVAQSMRNKGVDYKLNWGLPCRAFVRKPMKSAKTTTSPSHCGKRMCVSARSSPQW